MLNVKSVCKTLMNAINNTIRKPAPKVSAIVMLCSLAKRPGLSTIMSLIYLTKALKKKNIPTGPNPDGSPNCTLQFAYGIFDEVYRAMREDMYIRGAGAPASISLNGSGITAVGVPLTFKGLNDAPYIVESQAF